MNSRLLSYGSIKETTEFPGNERLEHVDKYVCLGSTRVPSEQQRVEQETIHDRLPKQKQHKKSEESDEMDTLHNSEESDDIDVQHFEVSNHLSAAWFWDPGEQSKNPWAPRKLEWIKYWFNPSDCLIDDKKMAEHISELTKSIKYSFAIRVAGYCEKGKEPGYGAIICDHRCKPLIAQSKVLPEEELVSPFYHELQGVDLGLQLAIKYSIYNFRFYCTSASVDYFIEDCLYGTKCTCTELFGSRNHLTRIKECNACLKSRMPVSQMEYAENLLPVVKSIISSVSTLESQGLLYKRCSLTGVGSDRNKVAESLAKLGKTCRMFPSDIQRNSELTDLLYADADKFHRTFDVEPE